MSIKKLLRCLFLYDSMPLMDKKIKTYEVNYLITPLIPEDKIGEEVSVLRKIIEDNNGLIISEDQIKMQSLSYQIGKFNRAYCGWFKFSANPESINIIQSGFKQNEKALRFLFSEIGKENTATRDAFKRRTPLSKIGVDGEQKTEKMGIKPEEIDKRLEELIGK